MTLRPAIPTTRVTRCTLALVAVLITAAPAPVRASEARAQTATAKVASNAAAVSRAPIRPPLASGGAEAGPSEDATATPQGESDPLVSNGLGSPTCGGALAGELSLRDRGHCETSGFVAAPAPTANYGIDVHIDTGLLGLNSGGLLSTVQDVFVTPLWMALVWAVHALVVMLEWSFTIDLLNSAASGGLARGLHGAERTLTNPWLPLALAVASVLALYHGLIRRRVAATLGEALVMIAMIVGGLWVMANPMGTVGALGQWANEAALGTMAATARGTPAAPGRTLGESLDGVFAAAIEAPWCYLEFGDVEWCRNPSRLDSGLRRAGLAIAAKEALQAGCKADPCKTGRGSALALEHSAELLREAHSNGAIFLALPANGAARNSINEQGSLLRTLCASSEATNCQGPTAAQAQFRTAGQTWSRVGGVLLIAAGLLGMLLLLGFVAVRLLAAAIFSLLYLLLAPAMVLAPAFGEHGRALFRRWSAQLLGAVVSKLLFAFLLGVLLATLAIITDLSAIGWWTQWLLMSAFWWAAYLRRHQALGVVGGALGSERAQHRLVVRRMSGQLEARRGISAVRWAKERYSRPAPAVEKRAAGESASGPQRRYGGSPRSRADKQATRVLQRQHAEATERVKSSADDEQRIASMRSRLERVRSERAKAIVGGDTRRAAQLGQREQRIEDEIDRQQQALDTARRTSRVDRKVYAREHHGEQQRFLDAQATRPASAARIRGAAGGSERRDYPRLASLAGHTQDEYEGLDPRAQRVARLQIDRELALRTELAKTRGSDAKSVTVTPPAHRLEPELHPPVVRARRAPGEEHVPGQQRPVGKSRAVRDHAVRDMYEVAAWRKRQLGVDQD